MMGRLKNEQSQLVHEFRLGDTVPEDHLVRKIDTALDLSWLRGELTPHYSSMGRPSIDPELMIRMLVVGYVFAIQASRSIRQAEVGAAKTMIERTEERFGFKPERLVGDTAYGAAPMLNWLVEEKGIAPHIPVFDKSKRDVGTFSRSDFRYDPTSDVYHCPGGKRLGTSGTVHEGKTLLYRASKLDCGICPLKPQCYPKEPSRKIPRDIHERAKDVARSFAGTEGFEKSRRERKKIEMRFAHLKRILKLGRLRLRGPQGAQDEFVLAAIAQNLRRLASLVARAPPAQALRIA
ncbi:transposase [Bradyrhizobium sp. 172]|uniref:transposase n=1 Tax=Bradyrhizobium sp. 172 TaxID=2782643 RepID=UPI001FFECEEB|nr:transposase [Bradyrhizobium sp. 172]UPJ94929.1 transposase [Bradyrhizobium sp. 172]